MEKKTNTYETVIILSASLEDEVLDAIQKKYEELFSNSNIEINKIEKWGRKRMAYQIKKVRTGYYIIFRYKSEGTFINRLERALKLDEQIVRYLTVKLDKRALNYLANIDSKVKSSELDEIDEFEETGLSLDEKELDVNNEIIKS